MKATRVAGTFFAFGYFFATGAFAQTYRIEQVTAKAFPEVEMQVWDRNPMGQPMESWELFEGERSVSDWQCTSASGDARPHQKALILFENSYFRSFDRQRDYLKEVLLEALSAFEENDSLYFATFDWTLSNGRALPESAIIRGTKTQIGQLVADIDRPPSGSRRHPTTELHAALFEGLLYLDALPDDSAYAKSIWVFSGEMSNLYNPQHTQESIVLKARQADIPVYCVRYPRVAAKYSLAKVATETFGLHFFLDSEVAPSAAAESVATAVRGARMRCAGKKYRFVWESATSVGGAPTVLKVKQKGRAGEAETVFHPPSFVAFLTAPSRWVVALCVLLALVGAVVGVFVWTRRKRRRAEAEKDAANLREVEEHKAMTERQLRDIEELKSRERSRVTQEEEARAQASRALHERESIARFKQLPRAPQLIATGGGAYPLRMATTVGRSEQGCQIVVNDPTLSREHAMILFEKMQPNDVPDASRRFYLLELGSTNGSKLNGSSVRGALELKDGDLIQLGAVQFTFRL